MSEYLPASRSAHESLNTSQGYIDATANRTRQAAANQTYRTLEQLRLPVS